MVQLFPRPRLHHWIWGFLVIFTTFSYSITGQLGIRALLPNHTLFYGFITPFLLAFFEKYNQNATTSLKKLAYIVAFIFSQFITIEGSFYHIHSWGLCFGSWNSITIWCVRSFVYTFVFAKILSGILFIIEEYNSFNSGFHFNLHKWFLWIVIIRIITLLFFYPCVFGFDAAVGLRTYLDSNCATCNHHPYFIQLIHGFFFSVGKELGNISLSFAVLSLLSILYTSSIILYGLKILEKSQLSRNWLLAIASIYSFFPLFPYLSINPTKDGLFAYSFLLYLFTLYELHNSKGICLRNFHYLIIHGISILLVCLTRHQGIYIIFIESLFLLINYLVYWKRIILITIFPLFLLFVFNKIILPYNNVEPGGKQEIFGTLFQQTAYCIKLHPDDVTKKELTAINNILNSDTIVVKYSFDKTDAVKNGYKYNPWYRIYPGSPSMFRHIDREQESDDLKEYLSAWASMGLKHPFSYIEATLGVSAGFFYNFNRLLLETEPKWAENPAAITPEYNFPHFNSAARIYNNKIYYWFKYPIINWIIAIPYYNWIAIFLIALIIYHKDLRGFSIFLPIVLSIGILFICPMIYGRYVYPIVMGLPLLIAYILSAKTVLKKNNNIISSL